jgi:hypothetical protein
MNRLDYLRHAAANNLFVTERVRRYMTHSEYIYTRRNLPRAELEYNPGLPGRHLRRWRKMLAAT